MVRISRGSPKFEFLADLLKALGNISPKRIRFDPVPGTATERDLIRIVDRKEGLCELVDGTLVEKPVGSPESRITNRLIRRIDAYVDDNDLGYTLGSDGAIRLRRKLIRLPDLSFISWERRPDGTYPVDPISNEIPNLVVEVISPSNTPAEMKRKLKEYFRAGISLVWYVYPRAKRVVAYTGPKEFVEFTEKDRLDGGDVLPGFSLELRELFAVSRQPAQKKGSANGRQRN
jgi:Uma2 family endonuclease